MNNEFGIYSSRFQAYVAWVDHNGSINDEQEEGVLENISPQTGRNLHLGVFKMSGDGSGVALNVVVPQDVLGTFKVPQVGDVVWIEETRREYGKAPTYLFSTYNSNQDPTSYVGQTPVPQWGSFSGDYGHLRTHRDHNKQFVATISSNFVKKYIRSVTGYRFRSFYRSNLEKGRYVVRGDSVFDIGGLVSEDYLVENGAYVGYGGDLEADQGNYPNPLNTPKSQQEDENYKYISYIHEPVPVRNTADHDSFEERTTGWTPRKEKHVLKNKDYVAYQPVMDKTYLEEIEFERELPAAEEYQVALRGNNKLLIQDQYGDGEQLLITLKTQYDAGFTVVHNADKSQVRIRDHMGQGVLLEANPDAPRVISWTANRQVIEQGSVKDVGEFTYIRNGSAFGDSETDFGTKTGLIKDDVSNQEFLMVSTAGIIGELGSRLSSGMNSLVSSAGSPGVYMRNNVDPDESSQTYAMYKSGASMVVETAQENLGVDGSVQSSFVRQEMDGSTVVQTNSLKHDNPATPHEYNETVVVSSAEVTKTSLLNRVGSDTIETIESITGDNTASLVRNMVLLNGSQITHTEDGASASVITNLILTGDSVADIIASPGSIQTIKYESGLPVSSISQTGSAVNIDRIAPDGLGLAINVGNDPGTGAITIGSGTSPVIINGTTIDLNAP